jgi:AAA domain
VSTVTTRDDSWAEDRDDADLTPSEGEIQKVAKALLTRRAADRLVKEIEAEHLLTQSSAQVYNGVAFLEDVQTGDPVWGSGKTVAWAKNQGFMVFGSDGTGKSTLLQQIVFARLGVRAADVLGFPVAQDDDRSILYLALDRPAQIRESISRMVDLNDQDTYDTLKRRLVIIKGPVPFQCDDNPKAFVDWCLKLAGDDCGMVIIDSVKDMVSSCKEDVAGAGFNDTMQAFIAKGVEFGCAHHNRKENAQNTKPRNLADVYGSRWLTAGMGSVLNIWRNPDASRDLTQLKTPYGSPFRPVEYADDFDSGTSQINGNWRDALVTSLFNAGAYGLTDSELVRSAFGQDTKDAGYAANRQKITRQLKAWIDSGSPYERADGNRGETSCKVWRFVSEEHPSEQPSSKPNPESVAKQRRAKAQLATIDSKLAEIDRATE